MIQSDPTTAIEAYRRILEYEETSTEENTLGGRVILILKGNRKQDLANGADSSGSNSELRYSVIAVSSNFTA
jgi:hypothetical protein